MIIIQQLVRPLLLVAAAVLAAAPAVAEPESDAPIRISQGDWTGNVFTSTVVAKLLGEMGYNVQIVPITGASVYTSLESGDLTLELEAWTTSVSGLIDATLASGRAENLGPLGLDAMDRWWYPAYVKDDCPGLPDWKALNDCAALFATPETGDKGRLLLYPEDWGGHDAERIASLGLNLQPVYAGSEAALLAEVRSAVAREAPILVWLYEPHWAPYTFDGEYVALPPYTDECYASGSYACEKPSGPVLKIANADMGRTWPGAREFVRNFQIGNEEYSAVIKAIDIDGRLADEVADEWIAANEERWRAWMPH